jgi:hypothetical protein
VTSTSRPPRSPGASLNKKWVMVRIAFSPRQQSFNLPEQGISFFHHLPERHKEFLIVTASNGDRFVRIDVFH